MSISSLGGSSFGGIRGTFQPPSFQSIDSNSDSSITLDELKAGAPGGANVQNDKRTEALFSAMDADGSGSVSEDEKSAFDAKLQDQQAGLAFMAQQMGFPSNDDILAATDTDSDGAVSLEEFSASDTASSVGSDKLQELFSLIDSDSDGSISSEESSDFLDGVKFALAEFGQAGGPNGAGGPPPGPPPGGPPPAGPPPSDAASASASEGDNSSDETAIDLLTAATNAYSSTSSVNDLLSTLQSIFDTAA